MNARSISALAVLTLTLGGLAGSGCARGSSGTSADHLGEEKLTCASSAECPAGSHCSTEDGVCNPPPGCAPGQPCPAVCHGACVAGACRSDSDCRTFSDYCTGCDCRSLSVCEEDPVCPGPGVMCLIEPCWSKEAFCDAGRCALRDPRATCPVERCGPQLGMPNFLCPDGKTVAGPSERCLANGDGSCGWEIASGPDPSLCR